MKSISLGFRVWVMVGMLVAVFIRITDSYLVDEGFETRNDPTITYNYDRIDEVKKECAFVLSSASALKPDDSRVYNIEKELSFSNGDWEQEEHGAPLMPFDDREVLGNSSDYRSPLNLVSFSVKDIDRAHRFKNFVSVSGVLQLGITPDSLYEKKLYRGTPRFDIWPGHSQLSISFQGIYTESEENGGERVMCLLGDTMLPSRQSDSSDPWEWVKDSSYSNQPPLLQDDQILLILCYPMASSLTKKAIRGEMKSLNRKSNLKYFDKVHISSQLGPSANYEFGSENIVAKACNPYPYEDSLMNGGIDIYKGLDFCPLLKRLTGSEEALTVVPNWRCNGTDNFCSKLGPFISDKEIKATDGGFRDVKLLMQNIRCEQTTVQDKYDKYVRSAKVAAVFRAVRPLENQYTAGQRSGLGNNTVSAEGIWRSSSGQLCMVGCLGLVDAVGNVCDSRICLYIPLSFSIKQQSIIVGSFSSIDNSARSYFPLSFEMLVQPSELWDQLISTHPYYTYSKIDLAGIVLEKNEPFSFGAVIKKSLLDFPKLESAESFLVSLSLLSEDLTLHVTGVPDPYSSAQPLRTDIQMVILSLGPLFGRHWSSYNGSIIKDDTPYHTKAEYTEKQLLLNVSARLTLTGKTYNNFSVIFLEGLYDPHVGKMYLIGCRDVRASWKILFESMDLEAGLDCLIEVVVSYPPTTSRWLVNPTARISISSQRNDDDPLHFAPIKLQTFPILYRKQREDILSRRGIEGILRTLTLSLAIACILSQLLYIRDNVDSVPFISLVMLGVQALGYSLPLVTGAEALFKKMKSESYERPSYDLENNQWIHVIDYMVKLLVLVCFLLTLRLCQKVWKARIRLLMRAPLEPHRVPSDKRVLFTTLTIHVVGYIIVLIHHSIKTSLRPLRTEKFVDSMGNFHTLRQWETELDEYVGLVQDFFLLPQIIGNFLWQIDCQPLRNMYFIGITVVRFLPHVYDYIRAPVSNPYFSQEYEFVNPRFDFYSKFGDVAIPVTAIFLSAAVYIQQRWNYEKLSQRLTFGQRTLLPLGSKVYQRLPSKSFEAELVSGVNENTIHKKEHDDEE
ncbi:uncharacterized protein LOC131158104 [Malania oleifera]|uniref:uncharacterized protein LOC131158104 n=1 Tax=Malania oleifera TaxID=397392 RepID=UPI0025ADD73E|nr:uncharacterized protein LOC131158104 [Malania oleifera]